MSSGRWWLVLAVLVLAACGQPTATGLPATPTRPGNAPPTAVSLPTQAAQAEASAPPPTVAINSPTPTALAEGLGTRLGTPDPNPNCPEHYPWFFENTADECASTILNTWSVLQPFERGLMLWTQEGGRTYVLIDDGSPFMPVQIVSDPLGLPLPEADPSLAPPEGRYQPLRGFALFWRNLVPGHEWVRERLGWATAPETAYSGFYQCNTATGEAARCYINGPRDEIIALAGGAPYWAYVQTPVR